MSDLLVKAKRKNCFIKKDFNNYQYCEGEYSYIDSFAGSSSFSGKEEIFYQGIKVYVGYYHGGELK